MTEDILSPDQVQVLYLLLNDQSDPKYFYPHYREACVQLTQVDCMIVENRRTKEEMIKITSLGRTIFTRHFCTSNVVQAMRKYAYSIEMTKEHWDLVYRLITGYPIAATDLSNEIPAFDLVNRGYATIIFTTSGAAYYTKTDITAEVFCRHNNRYFLHDAIDKYLKAA